MLFSGGITSGLHLWTADTQTKATRAAWFKTLEKIESLHPAIVVPGHAKTVPVNASDAINFSKDYLRRYEQELDKAPNAAALIEAMKRLYPDAGLDIALQIGAKVNKGEMKW